MVSRVPTGSKEQRHHHRLLVRYRPRELAQSGNRARSLLLACSRAARVLLVLDSSQVTTRESCREFDTRSHDAEAVGCRRLWRGAGVVHWQLRERAHVPRG